MPLRRIEDMASRSGLVGSRVYSILQYFVLIAGLVAMCLETIPDVRPALRAWLTVGLWCCLGFFTFEMAVRLWTRRSRGRHPSYLFSAAGLIDALAVLPIPCALLAGVPAETAWLLASLWVLKLAAVSPGLLLLGRIVRLEARPLASVFIIFLIVLLLASVALYSLERAGQPEHFRQSAFVAVVGGHDADHDGLRRCGAANLFRPPHRGRCDDLRPWGVRPVDRHSCHRIRHRAPPPQFIRNWDLVTSVPFLRSLDAPAIIELTRMLRRLDVAERSVVIRRGRPGDCMYFIASGEVEVKLEPNPIRLGTGSFFGEIALLQGGPRTATVVTTMPTTLLILEVTDFRAFTAHHPELAQCVEAEAARRASAIKGETSAGR